jgi:hypothetical protein
MAIFDCRIVRPPGLVICNLQFEFFWRDLYCRVPAGSPAEPSRAVRGRERERDREIDRRCRAGAR